MYDLIEGILKMRNFKAALFSATALIAFGASGHDAQAAYAYASNQITGMIVTYADSTLLAPSFATTTVNDAATFHNNINYPSMSDSGFTNIGTANNIIQATSGPITATPPPENTWTQAMLSPALYGARADAWADAGSPILGGGIALSNVGEAQSAPVSNDSGSGQAGFSMTISFQVVGDGRPLIFSFTDLYQLAALSVLNQTATASIANSFSINGPDVQFNQSPTAVNTTLATANGNPPSVADGPTSQFISITTPALTTGLSYTVNMQSQAIASIATTQIPEPTSLALLGASMLGLGMVGRRRKG